MAVVGVWGFLRRSSRAIAGPARAASGRALLAIAIAWLLAAGVGGASPSASASGGGPTVVDLRLSGQSQRVPPSFLGLSFEYDQLLKFEAAGRLFDRMLAVMRTRDGYPTFVRLGGRSADYFYWNPPPGSAIPRFVYVVQPQWLTGLGALVHRDRLRIEFDLNLAVHSPAMEVAFVRAALKVLPPRGLASLAIGNEPDLYFLTPWLERERVATTLPSTPRHWVKSYSSDAERRYYRSYAQAFHRAFPHTPLAAPDVGFPDPKWMAKLVSLRRLAPQTLSVHRYATAYCRRIHFHGAPSVTTFLKNGTSAGLAGTLRRDLAIAQAHGATVRVPEMNSVTCGGQDGVANSFATALWAPDVMFEMMREGVQGVNFHIRPRLPNAPFHIDSSGVQAQPEVYGLALFARAIGPSARVQELTPRIPSSLRLKAWAVSSRDGLKLLLINKSGRRAIMRFSLPGARRAATVVRLSAKSPRSTTGVTLGGQSIGTDGRWRGQRATTSVAPANNVYRLPMPAYSAALVKLGHI